MNKTQRVPMPTPVVSRMKHVACVQVIGSIWEPGFTCCAYQYQLSTDDLGDIGEFTRDAFESWLDSHAGDFQSIADFCVQVGNEEIPWNDEDSECTFNDCMNGG